MTFIHKHSRAQAFSIFRGHSLPQRHLKTSSSILLAPKKVQEQFTSTRTTSKLSTHGLLEDREKDKDRSAEKERERLRREAEREREREREREKEGKSTQTGSVSSNSGTAATNSASTSMTSMTSQSQASVAESGQLRLRIEAKSSSEREALEGGKHATKGEMSRSPVSPSGGVSPSSVRLNAAGGVPRSSASASSMPSPQLGSCDGAKDKLSSPSDADTPVSRTHSSLPLTLDQEARYKAVQRTDGAYSLSNADGGKGREGEKKRPESSLAESRASVFSEGSQGSHQFSSAISAWDQSSIASSRIPMSALPTTNAYASNAARGSVGSLDDQPIRTSHAEAFAALEPPYIEYLRMHSANYDGDGHDSAPSRFRGLRKLFHPQPLKSGVGKHSPLSGGGSSLVGSSGSGGAAGVSAVLEGHYTPPWLTMAARSKQEEQERVIKNLNDSFRDVGLLPSFKPNKNNKKEKKKKGSENVFDIKLAWV